jgi:hypothetical protein
LRIPTVELEALVVQKVGLSYLLWLDIDITGISILKPFCQIDESDGIDVIESVLLRV